MRRILLICGGVILIVGVSIQIVEIVLIILGSPSEVLRADLGSREARQAFQYVI